VPHINVIIFTQRQKLANNYLVQTFPTAVEPVNEIFDTSGCWQSNFPTAGVFSRELVITFSTPGGKPTFSAN